VADDDRFVAINVRTSQVVDNIWATGRVFALALNFLAGGLEGKRVLLLGCGPVGRAAAWTLAPLKAKLILYDIIPEQAEKLAASLMGQEYSTETAVSLEAALAEGPFILDATPAADIISEHHLTAGTLVAAPGVPLGLTPAAARALGPRLIHDPLQLGVAAMASTAARTNK
ncbi:MAG: 3-methylornithyl-N6-L-lysine dehydrogenase PylD, partial [Deltaproteobacteria bacterium]|nr:3-methylornithyl-N6-L-lysine dehydrogenase PylD [Deltaproteobacteria bacterium]